MPSKKLLKILFVEDLPSDAELAILELRKAGLTFEDMRVDTRDEFIKALEEFNPDIVISDYMMPSYNGLKALGDAREYYPEIPFILYTGSMNEEIAVECLKAGADDYIIKEHPARLPYAVNEVLDMRLKEKEKRAGELLLKENEEKLQSIFSAAPVGIGLVVNRVFMEVNDTFCVMTGYARKELIGKSTEMVYATTEEYESAGIEKYRQIKEKGTGSVETRFKCKDGTILNVILSSAPLDKDDLLKGVTFTVLDITERVRAEEALNWERSLVYSLMSTLPDRIYFKDLSSRFIRINKAQAHSFNLEDPSQAIGKTDSDFFTSEHAMQALEDEQMIIRTGQSLNLEERETHPDRPDTWVTTVKMPLYDKEGSIIGTFGISRDITERKRTEMALRESEEKYRLLIDTANESIIVIQDGLFRFVNRITTKLLEISSMDDLIGKPFPVFIHPDDRKMVIENYRLRITNKAAMQRYEFRVITATGLVKWVEISAVRIEWNGKPATMSFLFDITERKRAGEVLKESEEKYRRIFENVQDVYFETSIEGTIHEVSPSIELLSKGQYKTNDLIGRSMCDFCVDPGEWAVLISQLNEYGAVSDYEVTMRNKDSSGIPCSASLKIYVDALGDPQKIIGSMRDITYRKYAEEQLKKKQSQLINAHIIAHLGSWEYDVQEDMFIFNDPFYALLRTTAGQAGGYRMKSAEYAKRFVHPDDINLVSSETRKAIETDDPNFTRQLEHRIIYADGETGHITVRFYIEKNSRGKTIRTFGVNQDITEQKRAVESLRQSELRFKQISEHSAEWIWEVDKNGLFTYSSPTVKEILGYDYKEVISKKYFYDFFNPIDGEQLKKAALDLFKRRVGFRNFPNSNLHKDGREVILSTSAIPIFDSGGNYVGFRGVDRDITESKNAEEALQKSEEKFRSTMENSADAIFITDQKGQYQYVNKAASDMLGYTSDEILSKTILEITPPDKRDSSLEIFKKVLSEGRVYAEIYLQRKDGSYFTADLNSVLLPGGMVYGSCRDITERKQVQEELKEYREHLEELVYERTKELNKAKKEAEEANKAKSEFLANMSHEIRTPMNAVLGYSELLSSTTVDQTQENYINSIKSSGRSLLTLINDILDLSKIEAGKLDLKYDYVDTCFFFTEFERIFAHKVGEKGLKFILDIASGTPAGIKIDEARVRQIVFNLIGNAIKFTSDGNIVLKVFTENPRIVRYSKDETEESIDLIIEVQDTGIGITKALQEAIFKPFVQGRGKEHHGGTGLGLTITRRLASLMHGTITVDSKPGLGSTFTVRIPRIAYQRDFAMLNIDIKINPSEILFEKSSIIIADDTEHNRSFLRDALKTSGIEIFDAEDGIAAYKIAKEIVPDLIIADVLMPEMDGFWLLNKIKADKRLKHIPVIAYSASVLKDQKDRINNSEFAGLLVKPVKVTELYHELMRFLPYKSTRAGKPDESLPEVDLIGEISDRNGLIHSLETDLYATWETFAVRQPIAEIREFGKNLIQLGMDHHSSIITGYGKELVTAADSFNIEAILNLKRKYTGLIEFLRESSKIPGHD
ncbi:MAG: PAS domain S-box protein [Bacteroidales bacterium]|nr:PAS domain S-box protein [Bacteroidales bacterium]